MIELNSLAKNACLIKRMSHLICFIIFLRRSLNKFLEFYPVLIWENKHEIFTQF